MTTEHGMQNVICFPRPNFGDETIFIQIDINFNEKYLADYLEIILFITSNASLVYELNNHHQAARHLRLQYTSRSAIFFKFGFLVQTNGRRVISNF